MIPIHYQKRKNEELFKSFEGPESLDLYNIQNYIPIYKRFFTLNETNYNNVNLNHKWYITHLNKKTSEINNNAYNCQIKNIATQKTKEKQAFFKIAPLLDPYKYLIGKYNINDINLFNLPNFNSNDRDVHFKVNDYNNSAYVDGFFVFLNSILINEHNFPHGIDYYGSFLAIQNNFKMNVFDDIEHLNNSEFFNKNKNILFKIDNYEYLIQEKNDNHKLKPINIDHNISLKSTMTIQSFTDDLFENIFDNNTNDNTRNDNTANDNLMELESESNLVEISKLIKENDDIENSTNNQSVTVKSNSTCSSRSSYTSNENSENSENDENTNENEENKNDDEDGDSDENEDADEDEDEDEEKIEATLNKFPVKVICMEHCDNTFDDLIISNELSHDEWFSALMQIIMILITYQKVFSFTHNDLHTNNVMYNYTNKKYLYYCYKNIYYKVPTFGRIFKIIDFGRSIYKCNGQLFCSDSFRSGEDASSQYNTEPYFKENKPRLEPNFSFDICRLACSIFDYLIDDIDEIADLNKCDPIKRLIVEWCLDDKGINLLYKNNGSDRYPDFKLYKMIARHVHKHTPQAQLERPEFKAFSKFNKSTIHTSDVINIDEIPVYI